MACESAAVIGANVAILRKRAKLTQKQLAEACGISTPRISEFESGLANPTVETLERIASELGVTVSRLFQKPRQTA